MLNGVDMSQSPVIGHILVSRTVNVITVFGLKREQTLGGLQGYA